MQTLTSLLEEADFFFWHYMKAKVCKTQPASILDLKQRILQQGYSWGNGGVVPLPRAEELTARQNEYLNEK
jgi:hypothetical protein